MTNKEEIATDPADDEALVPIGHPCGVCQWPTAPGVICGVPVYAVAGKGALPKYCGAEGQAEWQAKWNSRGYGHRSDRAGYARKVAGNMSAKEAKRLADERARELGIHHRAPRPPAELVSEDQTPAAAPAQESAATPPAVSGAEGVQLDRLAETLSGAGELVNTLRAQIEAMRVDFERRIEQKADRARAAIEAESEARHELSSLRAESQRVIDDAATKVREARAEAITARDEQIAAEARLADARERVSALENELATVRAEHREEIERVRRQATESAERLIDSALARRSEVGPAAGPEVGPAQPQWWQDPANAPADSVVSTWIERVQAGHVTRTKNEWLVGNAPAIRPAAAALDWLASNRRIRVGKGDPAPVSVVNAPERR